MTGTLRPDANDGAVALVTGGGTGIGRATATALASTGAKVAVCGRREAPLESARAEIEAAGGECLVLPGDVREPETADRLVASVLDHFGKLDVLVHSAGGQFAAAAEDISVNGWRAVHRLSVEAAWGLTRAAALGAMIPQRRGVIVFIGFSPRRGVAGAAHGAAARAALENLASGLALEWSRFGIRSLCVAVGTVESEGLNTTYSQEQIGAWERSVPLGRLGTGAEVGELIAFLASPGAAYVTGTTIVIDGGADAWGAGGEPPPPSPPPANGSPA